MRSHSLSAVCFHVWMQYSQLNFWWYQDYHSNWERRILYIHYPLVDQNY